MTREALGGISIPAYRTLRTPETQVMAVRALQESAALEVRRHFAIEPDGSFMLDVSLIETD